jgi:ribulose-5-phosphate 4-epimerase/fuculose-1-phosphate aldolase
VTEHPNLSEHDSALVEQIIAAAHEAHRERILICTSGNLSARLECGDRIAITGAGTRLGILERDQLVCASIADGATLPGVLGESPDSRASTETPFHTTIYREFPEVGAVLHCQSFAATYYACRDAPLPNLNVIPEMPIYVGMVGRIPFVPPNTQEIGDAIAAEFRNPGVTIVQLGNHGQVVIGKSPLKAVQSAVFFELACRLCLLSETRDSLRPFTPDEIELLEGYR